MRVTTPYCRVSIPYCISRSLHTLAKVFISLRYRKKRSPIRLVQHKVKEGKGFIAILLIPVWDFRGDEDNNSENDMIFLLAESVLLSLMGIAFGALGGIFLSMVLTGVLDFAGLHIPYNFPTAGVITAIAVGLICGILAALIPARRASDLEIVAALAYE
jgi:hypothetical protein